MKRLLTRACAKIARFFWSWGFLKFVLVSVTLIILLYAEEDWRGARAWAATKAEWEAKGESFDFNRLIPPPVPDDQNLAALPLFKMEPDPDPKNKGHLAPLALQRALRNDLPGNNLFIPHVGNWQEGQLPDMKKFPEIIAADYAEAFKTAPPPNDSLAQFDALYPFVADLRTAAATRPFCRFQIDYLSRPPAMDFIWLISEQIHVAKVVDFHAVLAFAAHKPDLALEDIKTNLKLISGLRQQPFIVSGLVAIGMIAISENAIYDGLALHSWNDAQLADLQNELSKVDFLSDCQRAMRGEIGVTIPAFDNLKAKRPRLADELKSFYETPEAKLESWGYLPNFWADGWLDLWKVQAVNFNLNAVRFVDPKARLVFPKTVNQFTAEVAQRQGRWEAYAPWNLFADAAAGSIANAVSQFARIQVRIDEARIACALERYRLAHKAYPDTLDALVPACADELPHDIMNGQPYHYRLRPDGTFLLYSVGWNQTDDGGKVVFKYNNPSGLIDYTQGDWVWPTPQLNPQK
ncbi:MAG TPA: hypothetical protein VGZ93_12955 [Candidatus Methylacidiphilales bacterium]|jgi:hypothetical protein|nr:hypothetical protein [Candidatus Methylacidiphilales bacterium]